MRLFGGERHGLDDHEPPERVGHGSQGARPAGRQQGRCENAGKRHARNGGHPEAHQRPDRRIGKPEHDYSLLLHSHVLDDEEHQRAHDCGSGGNRAAGVRWIEHKGEIAAGCKRRAERGKQAFEEHGPTHQEAEPFAHGAASIGERTARERHHHRQFRQSQDPGEVEHTDDYRSDQHSDGSSDGQAEVPAEVLAGDHHSHAQRPDMNHAERLLQNVLADVLDFFGEDQGTVDMGFGDNLVDDGIQFPRALRPIVALHHR